MEKEDVARLIHESLEQLGWDINPNEIAELVLRLNQGLPAEDEFSILCGWLGRCSLIHKLDQHQHPKISSTHYQVPDLLACFELGNEKITVLIEVKTNKKNKLSFTPAYYEKLSRYGELLNLPVLIAWKNKHGIWTLLPLSVFQKAKTNFNLSIESAMKESLLGVLAGDFAYVPNVRSGIHIHIAKEKLISTEEIEDGFTENWHMRVENVYFSNHEKEINLIDISSIAQQVLHTLDLESEETHTDTHITQHFICKNSHITFAHMALVDMLNFIQIGDEKIQWRKHIIDPKSVNSFSDFRSGVVECLKHEIIRYILDLKPQTMPGFLLL